MTSAYPIIGKIDFLRYKKQGEGTLADEKWNRFTATGSVRDYLEYRACAKEISAADRCVMREDKEDGADHPAEWNGTLSNAHRGL